MDEEQEQRVDMEFLVYGTRTSKDKSGAYLFLPDGEAQVPPGGLGCLTVRGHQETCEWRQ